MAWMAMNRPMIIPAITGTAGDLALIHVEPQRFIRT